MRKKKAAPVDIVYIRSNPVVADEITPKSIPNENGMKGIKEPSESQCVQHEVFDALTISQGPACSWSKVKLIRFDRRKI
jgi:hypothetical protein